MTQTIVYQTIVCQDISNEVCEGQTVPRHVPSAEAKYTIPQQREQRGKKLESIGWEADSSSWDISSWSLEGQVSDKSVGWGCR